MSKKLDFINYIKEYIDEEKMPEDVRDYWEAFRQEKEKPVITDNGKIILKFLQEHTDQTWTSKAIGEGVGMSSRSASGSMLKLASEGFVEKRGQDPISYAITEKGINFKEF